MKKQTRKWATALLAVSCASICIGAGVAAHTYSATDVTAAAENPYDLQEIGALTVHVNSSVGAACKQNDALYLKRADGQALPILSWDYAFATENENCFKVNGKPAALEVMKSTGDGMYFKFSALQPGDIVTVSGTYVCDSQATSYAITESSFKWDGSGWSDYVYIEYTEFNVGSLDYSHGNAKQVYFKPTNSEIVLPINNWDDAFSYGSGNGITVDGEMISMINSVKSPEGMFFADLGKNASVGSVLKIGGTLNCDKKQIAYVIEDCEFIWNGTTWVKQGAENPENPESSESSEDIESSETPIEYTTYTITKLDGANNCSETAVYAWVVEGDALGVNSWDHAFTFEEGSGEGMLLNGVAFVGWDMKQPGADLYIGLGTTADTGAVLTIDGTFYNEDKAAKIVFNNCQLQFNGTTWVTYGETPENPESSESSESSEDIESSETPIEYETYTINAIKAESTSSATAVYLIPADGDGRTLGAGDWENIYTLEAGSGEGLKLNGVALSTTDIKQPGSFFIGLGVTAFAGDVLTIDGAYYNNKLAKKIIFNNCEIEFDGSVWGAEGETPDNPDTPDSSEDIESSETPVEPTTYTITKLDGANNCSATTVFAWVVEGDALGVNSWDHAFSLEEGDGLYLNDQILIGWEIKQPGADLYIALGETAVAGDVLTINGTFYNEAKAATLIFNNCKLQFNGTTWETYREPIAYTYYELGQMIINAGSSTNSAIYIARADGGELPVHSWDYEFKFVYDSGCGLVFNGEAFTTKDVKSPGNEVYIGLGEHTAKEGDVMTVGGTFCNDDSAVAYVIEESTFVYMNNAWMNMLDFIKENNKAALDEYKNNFAEENYYEAEWSSFDTIIADAKLAINLAMAEAEIFEIVETAKKAMDDVVTKEESDAIFGDLKVSAKVDLDAYKNEADYKAEDWQTILAIVATAKTEIDGATSVTAINTAVTNAKTQIDAIKTAAEKDADAAVVAAAKAELAGYKSESDYKAAQWAEIQAILEKANVELDGAIGNESVIAEIVTETKAKLDEVKTATEQDAIEGVVAAAKAELAAYKNESDYKAEQWSEMQAIIANACADLDKAIGNESEIANIVTKAKAAMDKVLTATQAEAAALEAAKEAGQEEALSYYETIDLDLYSDDAVAEISGYVAAAIAAIESATTADEVNAAVAQLKTNVGGVAKLAGANEGKSSGCGSVVTGGLAALLAVGVAMVFKKKED